MNTPGRRHDGSCAQPPLRRRDVSLFHASVPAVHGSRPDHVIADRAFSSRGLRASLRERWIGHTIPEMDDHRVLNPAMSALSDHTTRLGAAAALHH